MLNIRALADALADAKTRPEVWTRAMTFLDGSEVTKVVFHDLTDPTDPVVLSNAAPSWTSAYRADVTARRDPFALHCLSRIDPVLTGIDHVKDLGYLDATALEHVDKGSADLGVRTGISITIRPDLASAGIGWNLMTPCRVAAFDDLRRDREVAWRAWCQLTSAALMLRPERTGLPRLTPREYDCLSLVADGYRAAAITDRLCIAESTVEMHLRNARTKLGARTRDEAVAIAVRSKLI